MHGCQWLKLEGLLRTSPDMHLLCLFGMTCVEAVVFGGWMMVDDSYE